MSERQSDIKRILETVADDDEIYEDGNCVFCTSWPHESHGAMSDGQMCIVPIAKRILAETVSPGKFLADTVSKEN